MFFFTPSEICLVFWIYVGFFHTSVFWPGKMVCHGIPFSHPFFLQSNTRFTHLPTIGVMNLRLWCFKCSWFHYFPGCYPTTYIYHHQQIFDSVLRKTIARTSLTLIYVGSFNHIGHKQNQTNRGLFEANNYPQCTLLHRNLVYLSNKNFPCRRRFMLLVKTLVMVLLLDHQFHHSSGLFNAAAQRLPKGNKEKTCLQEDITEHSSSLPPSNRMMDGIFFFSQMLGIGRRGKGSNPPVPM